MTLARAEPRTVVLRIASVSRTVWRGRPGVRVTVTDGQGYTGVGEAVPLPGRSGEDAAAAARALETLPIRTLSLPAPDASPDARRAPLAEAVRPLSPAHPVATFALEGAVLALLAARTGLPASHWLGRLPNTPPPARRALIADAADQAAARAAVATGASAVKVKVRRALDDTWPDLLALRERLGPEVPLVLDPNGAWSLPEARRWLTRLPAVAPVTVEQPVSPADLPFLTQSSVPLAADESLELAGGPDACLCLPAVTTWTLKPGTVGGLLAAHALAERALYHGRQVVLTHADDGPVAARAIEALAEVFGPRLEAVALLSV